MLFYTGWSGTASPSTQGGGRESGKSTGNRVPSRSHSKCKGPEVEASWVNLRKSKGPCAAQSARKQGLWRGG